MPRPSESNSSSTMSMPCRAGWRASSALLLLEAMSFSFTTVTTRTRFALSSSGRASATARAAGRLKSHAIATVSSIGAPPRREASGSTRVGRPEPNMTVSAYHCSTLSPSRTGISVRSRRRACSTRMSAASPGRHRSSKFSWNTL